jgi:hypothetical protein
VRRGITAVSEIDYDLLQRARAAMDYRIDVCRVTKGGNLQHLRGMHKRVGLFSVHWKVACYNPSRHSVLPIL